MDLTCIGDTCLFGLQIKMDEVFVRRTGITVRNDEESLQLGLHTR